MHRGWESMSWRRRRVRVKLQLQLQLQLREAAAKGELPFGVNGNTRSRRRCTKAAGWTLLTFRACRK